MHPILLRLFAFALVAGLASCGPPPPVTETSTVRQLVTTEEVAKAYGVTAAVYDQADHGDLGRSSPKQQILSLMAILPVGADGKTNSAKFSLDLSYGIDPGTTRKQFSEDRLQADMRNPVEAIFGLGDEAYYVEGKDDRGLGFGRTLFILAGDRDVYISAFTVPAAKGGPQISKEAFIALAHLAMDRLLKLTLPNPI